MGTRKNQKSKGTIQGCIPIWTAGRGMHGHLDILPPVLVKSVLEHVN